MNVSWNDATAFCEWLSRKERKTYRLPTEAEWEYACRAGTTTMFSAGNTFNALAGIANVADQSNKRITGIYQNYPFAKFDDGYQFTAPAGTFRTNGFGLADMHGNVWEWCADRFASNEYAKYANRTAENPQGEGNGSQRVFRGGSWSYWPAIARSSIRGRHASDHRNHNLGFRVASVPSGQ